MPLCSEINLLVVFFLHLVRPLAKRDRRHDIRGTHRYPRSLEVVPVEVF